MAESAEGYYQSTGIEVEQDEESMFSVTSVTKEIGMSSYRYTMCHYRAVVCGPALVLDYKINNLYKQVDSVVIFSVRLSVPYVVVLSLRSSSSSKLSSFHDLVKRFTILQFIVYTL